MLLALALAAAIAAPEAPDARVDAALHDLYDGSTDGAVVAFQKMRADFPADPLVPYFQALALEWKLEQQAASTTLDEQVQAFGDEAVQMAEATLATRPRDERALFARGAGHAALARYHLFRVHRTDAARASVRMREALLEVDPKGPYGEDAQFGLGLYDYYADVMPKVIKVLRFVIGIPGGDRDRGLAAIRRAAERSRFHATEARVQLFEIHAYWEDDPDDALGPLQVVHKAYPGSPLWGLKLAEHLRDRLGQYTQAANVARAGLEQVRRGHPNYGAPVVAALFRLSLGEALLNEGRLEEAQLAALPALDLRIRTPYPERLQLLLGRIEEAQGRRAAAVARYRQVERSSDRDARRQANDLLEHPRDPAEVRALPFLFEARELMAAGRPAEAAGRYAEATRMWPGSTEAFLGTAEERVRQGRGGDLRERLQKVAGDPAATPPWTRPWASLLLARLHDMAGRRVEAVELYRRVAERPSGDARLLAEARQGIAAAFRPVPAAGPSPAHRKP